MIQNKDFWSKSTVGVTVPVWPWLRCLKVSVDALEVNSVVR